MKHSSLAAITVCVLSGLAAGCAPSATLGVPDTSTLTADDVDRNTESIEKLLQAKVPGVLVTRAPDGNIALQIRGTSSFLGGNEPLYVIDGVPFAPGNHGILTGINPYDIESIKVLKNPEDIGLYGMRGANGVILITMKKPGRHGR
jgi:TonB-dependent SusC/RagA subfamily outer membrane receptor